MNICNTEHKRKGATLSQYVIIIALIALALVPLLFFTGKLLVQNFSDFSKWLSNTNTTMNSNTGNNFTIQAGQLNGSLNKPVAKCSGNMCSIDYGTFVLNGIPENYDEFVQTGGTSGGEDKLAEIIMQIADQYKDQGDTEGYEDFKKFANLVHINADVVRQLENKIKAGEDPQTFFSNNLINDVQYKVPVELSTTLPGLNLNDTYFNFIGNNCLIGATVEEQIPAKVNPYFASSTKKTTNNLSYALVDNFNTIQSKTNKYPESLRTLTQELYLNLNELQENSYRQMLYMSDPTSTTTFIRKIDPITGYVIDNMPKYEGGTDAQSFLHPKYSLKENLTGTIMCTAGKNQASARSCH